MLPRTKADKNQMRRVPGYFSLVGHVIKQAILDYKFAPYSGREGKKNKKIIFDGAKKFLFTDELEDFLRRFEIDGIVSAERIRRCLQ